MYKKMLVLSSLCVLAACSSSTNSQNSQATSQNEKAQAGFKNNKNENHQETKQEVKLQKVAGYRGGGSTNAKDLTHFEDVSKDELNVRQTVINVSKLDLIKSIDNKKDVIFKTLNEALASTKEVVSKMGTQSANPELANLSKKHFYNDSYSVGYFASSVLNNWSVSQESLSVYESGRDNIYHISFDWVNSEGRVMAHHIGLFYDIINQFESKGYGQTYLGKLEFDKKSTEGKQYKDE